MDKVAFSGSPDYDTYITSDAEARRVAEAML